MVAFDALWRSLLDVNAAVNYAERNDPGLAKLFGPLREALARTAACGAAIPRLALGLERSLSVASILDSMPTITIRNLSPRTVGALKKRAKRHGHSMEQEVRDLLEEQAEDRLAVLDEIDQLVAKQKRLVSARRIASWIRQGREERSAKALGVGARRGR
ncbi:MAG: hypothetical protein HYZ28_10315 [Myxococcales bacterium]|nr:hypothetical protein [Myxococcales bacterium]